MTVKILNRTATFAWGTSADSLPLIATGTVSGALDETFSNVGSLEIWQPEFFGEKGAGEGLYLGGEGQPGPRGSISTHARFNRLAWSNPSSKHARGLLASGMETGEVSVWDADKILQGSDASESVVFKNEVHTGPVRGLDFNPIQQNLLASGAINAELQVFDLTNPDKTHSTGPRSTKLDEITAVQWNPSVAHILAASSSSGYTSVWDLRQKREVLSLAYGGGAATGMQASGRNMGGFGSMQVGNKRGMSSVVWHPNNPTRLITASEDDTSPIVMVWDLRNSLAPEKILSGHDKGILSLSWCSQDSDLLLSCGKDNRTICWNPQSCEIVGELPSSDNWSFQTSWCPRNPDLIATASFDGKIGIHSLQNTHQTNDTNKPSRENITNPDDIFGSAPADEGSNATVLSLKQPPKWLRPPVSVAFGFGGQLASIGTSPAVNGKPGSSVLKLQEVVTEEDVVDRAKKLASAIGSQEELGNFCEDMAQKESGGASAVAGWKALKSLFTTNSRDELVTLLGFSKGEIANQVSEAIAKFKLTIKPEEETREPDSIETEGDGKGDITPKAQSEAGAGASVSGSKTPSEVDSTTDKTAEEDAESVEPSLFDDETRTGTPQIDTGAGAHFFSSIGNIRNALPDHMQVPHKAYAKDSSVAATIGSRASSVASDTMKSNTFKIYPSNESEVDRLVTRALVVGDFESAVTLCLSVDRFADALVLAVRGGPDLLAKTQQAYFEKRTTSLPYLRLFQSIVSEDLSDVVQNADLTEWQEVFVVLCTFARVDEFNSLTEQLGQRIEFQSRLVNGANASGNSEKAKELRKNALLCYLAAGRLEKAVNIWVDEMREEEDAAVNGEGAETSNASRYTAHARALQTFMEKVAVFKSATAYSDRDLAAVDSIENGARTYPLAALYDRYYEYADLLATQGQTELAVRYIKQTPANYKGSRGEESGLTSVRARYILGSSATDKSSLPTASTSSAAAGLMQQPVVSAPSAYTPYQQPFVPAPAPITSGPTSSVYSPYVPPQPVQPNQPTGTGTAASNPYTPAVNPYNPAGSSSPYAPGPSNYNPSSTSYGAYGQTSRPTPTVVAPPPMARSKGNDSPGPIPAAQRRDIPGWNDAPSVQGPKRTASAGPGKPQPIMSPFPEGQAPPTPVQMPMNQPYHQPGQFPPQTGRAQAPPIAPPPRGAQPPRPASTQPPPPPPMSNSAQYQSNKPMSPPLARAGPPPGVIAGPPPARAMSPLVPPQHRVMSPPAQQQQQHIRPPSAGPYQPPPGVRAGPPPSGQPARASPAPARTAPPPASVKAAPKYPAGDRSHIPATSQPIFETFSSELARLSSVVPPQQRKFLDDTQRRLNVLFDGLNCETIPAGSVAQLGEMVKAIAARDAQAALSMHVDMLTRGPRSDDMTVWMTGIKQIIKLGM